MKILTSKLIAKQIKKIKLVDYLFLLIIIVGALFLIFRFKRKAAVLYVDLAFSRNYVDGSQLIPQEYWQINQINPGDEIINNLGDVVGTVEDFRSSPWGGGQRRYARILVKLNSLKALQPGTYSFEGNPVFIGSKMTVNTGKTKFTGEVVNIFEHLEERFAAYSKKTLLVKVKAREYERWVVEQMKDFSLKDNQGKVLAEVVETNIQPAEVVALSKNGYMLSTGRHPYLYDADITFKMHDILCQFDSCYFDYYFPLLVGSSMWIDSGQIYIGPNTSIQSITAIDEN